MQSATGSEPNHGDDLGLSFLDAEGNLIVSYSSKEPEEGSNEKKPEPRPAAEPGMNRFVWNMRYPDAQRVPDDKLMEDREFKPLAPPGMYQVRLTLGGDSQGEFQTQTFEIVKDPRVAATQDDFDAQFELLTRIRDKLSATHESIMRLRSVRQQVDEWVARAETHSASQIVSDTAAALKEKLTEIESELIQVDYKGARDRLTLPSKLNSRLAEITAVAAAADFAPPRQAYEVYDAVVARIDPASPAASGGDRRRRFGLREPHSRAGHPGHSPQVDDVIRSRAFAYITAADFTVRSAYQMGKTPLLPIYAATLGAGDVFLGFIVSVSTLTGMLLKPFVGVLSDRWGRRGWLLIGTAFFAGMPFVYRFVSTPEQLFAVRMVHGLATAIYGPVTLAYVAEQSQGQRAERLAWFGTARNAGYVVGPALAGWMLLTLDPVAVFTVAGIMSSLAFVPVLLLPETRAALGASRPPLLRQALGALRSGGKTSAVWLAGGMEAAMFVALYATKTFLPIYALAAGFNIALVGTFFAVQEAAHIALNPIGGRIGDRAGYRIAIPAGMVTLAAVLPLLMLASGAATLLALAVLVGAAQALVFPSTVALVSARVDEQHLGAGMGLVGTMKNAGKVGGPVLAGGLIHWLDYALTFQLMAAGLLVGAVVVWQGGFLSLPRAAKGSA